MLVIGITYNIQITLNKHKDKNNTIIGGTVFPTPLTVPANECNIPSKK